MPPKPRTLETERGEAGATKPSAAKLARRNQAKRRHQSGQAMLVALGVTVILIGMLAITASNQQTALKAESARMTHRKTYLAAESAGQLAIQYLVEGNSGVGATTTATPTTFASGTTGPMPSAVTTAVSTTLDDWYATPATGAMKYALGDTSFRMQIIDGCSLYDINQTTSAELQNIGLTEQEADSINDFHSAGETPSPDGAKDTYYNGLQNPYNAKLARFDTVDELLQVQFITPDVLYDPQPTSGGVTLQALTNGQMPSLYDLVTVNAYAPNTTSTGAARTALASFRGQLSQATQRILFPQPAGGPTRPGQGGTTRPGQGQRPGGGVARAPNYTTMAQVFRAAPNMSTADATTILNNMTYGAGTTAEGLVNINTASQNVLMLLPNMTADIAAAIVQQQQQGFQTLGAIMTVPGVTPRLVGGFAGNICIASTTYECRVIVTAGTEQEAYIVVVQVSGGVPQIVSITPTPFPASQMLLRWGWQSDTTDETDLLKSTTS